MSGARHLLRFLEEAAERNRIGRLEELFDRDLAAQPWLLVEVDGTHAPPAQLAFDPVLADVAFARDPRRRGDGGDRRRRRGRWRDRDEAHRGGRVRRGGRCRWGRIGRIRRRSPRRNRGGGLGWLTGIGHLWASLPESFGPESGMAFCRRCADNLARSRQPTGGE